MKKLKILNLGNISLIVIFMWLLFPLFISSWRIIDLYQSIEFFYIPISISAIYAIYFLGFKFKDYHNKKYLLLYIAIGIFFVWTFISCLCASNIKIAFLGGDYRKEGFISYIGYLGFFIASLMLKKSDYKLILKTFLFTILFMSLISLMKTDLSYLISGQLITKYYFYRGCYLHFNHFGYLLLYASIISSWFFITTEGKKSLIYFFISIVIISTLIINDTFSCYLGFLIILLFVIIYFVKRKIYLKPLIILSIFIIGSCFISRDGYILAERNFSNLLSDLKIVNTSVVENDTYDSNDLDSVGTGRYELWAKGIKYIKKSPIVGYGPDNIFIEYEKDDINQTRPHNILIGLMTTSGIVGLISYLGIMFIILFPIMKKLFIIDKLYVLLFLLCISYFLYSMFGNSMYYTSPYFYIFLGGCASYYFRGKKYEI